MLGHESKILLYSSNLWYLGEGMLGPLFAVFAQRIGGSVLDISWAWATYLIVMGVLVIAVGKLADLSRHKEKILVVGYALNAVFTFAYLLVSSPWHLFLVQAGLGFASALAITTWTPLYTKYWDKKKTSFFWGLASGQGQIMTGIALVVGGLIVNYFSFAALFITMGIVQVIAAVYQVQILRR